MSLSTSECSVPSVSHRHYICGSTHSAARFARRCAPYNSTQAPPKVKHKTSPWCIRRLHQTKESLAIRHHRRCASWHR